MLMRFMFFSLMMIMTTPAEVDNFSYNKRWTTQGGQ